MQHEARESYLHWSQQSQPWLSSWSQLNVCVAFPFHSSVEETH